jgi:hypothetical protein
MVWYVLLRPRRPEQDGQDPFQICGVLCQTRKTPTLVVKKMWINYARNFCRPLEIGKIVQL